MSQNVCRNLRENGSELIMALQMGNVVYLCSWVT